MELFIGRLFDALANGSAYALIAMALVLIFKSTTLINFAQGEMAMFGAFTAWAVSIGWGVPIWIALICAIGISAILGVVIERVFIRPFDPADHMPLVIVTLGLYIGIHAVAGVIWGFNPRHFPELFPSGSVLSFGNARLSWYTVFTLLTVALVLVGLNLLLRRTRIGLAFRAVSSNMDGAELVGINIGSVLRFGWAISAAVGTLGAAVYVGSPLHQLEPPVMLRVLIFAAAAAALGGFDSLPGTVVGGMAIGLVQSVFVPYLPFVPNEMSLAASVCVLMAVLLVRPSGLFGTVRVQRV